MINTNQIIFNEMIEDLKEIILPFKSYIEYFCSIPKKYSLFNNFDDENNEKIKETGEVEYVNNKIERNLFHIFKLYNFTITNESLKECVKINNVLFDKNLEIIIIKKEKITLSSIVNDVINKLGWNLSQVIIVSNGEQSFSYGAPYYFLNNTKGEIIDVCVKHDYLNTLNNLDNLDDLDNLDNLDNLSIYYSIKQSNKKQKIYLYEDIMNDEVNLS